MFNPTVKTSVWSAGSNPTPAPLVVFGGGAQNTPTTNLFGNSTINNTRTSPFGLNQSANVINGANVKSNPPSQPGLFTFVPTPTPTNVFNVNNNGANTGNARITATRSNTSGGLFNQTSAAAPQNPVNLFTAGTHVFGASPNPASNQFNPGTSIPPANTSGFPWATTNPPETKQNIFGSPTIIPPNPLASRIATNQPVPNAAANNNTSAPFRFGPQPTTNNSVFPQATVAPSSVNTASNATGYPFKFTFTPAPANAPAFSGLNPPGSRLGPSNILFTPAAPAAPAVTNWLPQQPASTGTSAPATMSWLPQQPVSTGTGAPATTNWLPQSSNSAGIAAPATSNWFTQPNTSTIRSGLPNTNEPSKTSIFNPPVMIGTMTTGIQPNLTSSLSTGSTQVSKPEQTTSMNQQNFLLASLLDPYANCGKKNFSDDNLTQFSTVSTALTIPSKTAAATTEPTPPVLPVYTQTNLRKASSFRSSIDMNLKLKPVSSSPSLNDVVKPTNQRSIPSVTSVKSTLGGSFTDEEELVLLGQAKLSKLRLSNHVSRTPSESNVLRSLYPMRRLTELEGLSDIKPRSSTPTILHHQSVYRASTEIRDASPIRPSSAPLADDQSSSPVVQRKSSHNSSQIPQLPILTRDFYYMKPSRSELKSLFNDQGQCILKQFTVGHENYGSVTFYGQINVAGLNLDEIIEINRHEVIVYPDDDHKPPMGEELNLPARITLLGIYPTDRTTREEIRDIERIKATNYRDHLRELTKKFDGEFVNYGIEDGSWTFMVKHFTRYGLNDDQHGIHK